MPGVDELYVVARQVLLDALDALGAHRDALVLIGAQAVYLRVGGRRRTLRIVTSVFLPMHGPRTFPAPPWRFSKSSLPHARALALK